MSFMSEQSSIGNRQSAIPQGFTLLEVVVAIALMGAVLVVALELLAAGLRSAKSAGDYTQAVLMARLKLDELALQEPQPMSADGSVGEAYRWTAEVSPEEQEVEGAAVRLFRMRVKVSWGGNSGEKGVELVTLRAGDSPGVQRGVSR